MSASRERIYIAALTLAISAAALMGVLLWDAKRPPERVFLSIGEDGAAVRTDGR